MDRQLLRRLVHLIVCLQCVNISASQFYQETAAEKKQRIEAYSTTTVMFGIAGVEFERAPVVRVEIVTESGLSTLQVNVKRGVQNCTRPRAVYLLTINNQNYWEDRCGQDTSFQLEVKNINLNLRINRSFAGTIITMYAECQKRSLHVDKVLMDPLEVNGTYKMLRKEYPITCSPQGRWWLVPLVVLMGVPTMGLLVVLASCCWDKVRRTHKSVKPKQGHTADELRKRLTIKIGDISRENVDGIVFGVDAQVGFSSGVSKVIGNKLDQESRNHIKEKRIPQTGVAITKHSSAQIPADNLVLVNMTTLSTDDKEWIDFLVALLKICDEKRFKSLSFPVLGTGGLRIPCEKMAVRMLGAIQSFYNVTKEACLNDIRIVVYHRAKYNYLNHFQKVLKDMKAKDNSPLYDNWTVSYQGADEQSQFVQTTPEEYEEVAASFRKTIGARPVTEIVEIVKVNQPFLREVRFFLEQQKVAVLLKRPIRQITKTEVWHGTRAKNADQICVENFNRSFAGTNAGTSYGKGVYFSTSTNYSYRYSPPDADGIRHMIRAQIVVGDYTTGRASMRAPPPKACKTPFISTVDNIINPSIFVIYSDAAALPEYVVRFKAN